MNPSENKLVIRTLGPGDWPTYRDIRLRSLADSPAAFGSTLAAEQERTADAWAARLRAASESGRDCPLIAELSSAAVGLVWAKVDPSDSGIVNLFQMWVAPEARGCGLAAAMLRESVAWAKSRRARAVQLGVMRGNEPAARLYAREGFRNVGEPVPLNPGSPVLEQIMRLDIDCPAV